MIEPEQVTRIEAAALWAWPPRETAFVDGWLLRAADGHTRRANSARTAAFHASSSLERSIGMAEAWYAARGLPACFQLNALTMPADLNTALAARGYDRFAPTLVMLVAAAEPTPRTDAAVGIVARPTALVMNAICDQRWDPRTRRARAALFGRIRKPHAFAVAIQDGEPAAGGLCVVDGALAGLFALRTQHRFRRQGHARAVVDRLTAWARGHGATELYLQVEEENAPARAFFGRLGGAVAYRYWYRELAPGS